MGAYLERLRDIRFLRYLLASVGALSVDMGSFLLLLSAQVAAAPASAAGYSLGILAHWLLSSRTVFADSVAAGGRDRHLQKVGFVGSAFMGLGLTTLIVGAGDAAGIDPRLAKVVAIAVSFAATWIVRSRYVFRARMQ